MFQMTDLYIHKDLSSSTSRAAWTDEKFMKAMSRTGEIFRQLAQKFPQVSTARIKVGLFFGPQIKEVW
jgi:hypothetical protein